jgi:tRNA 2-thiouridine synthesizing protein A
MQTAQADPLLQIDEELDVRGYNCPIPLLRTKKALARLSAGERLHVLATDPGSELDFRVYTEASGHELVSFDESGGVYSFVIRKSAS